MKLKTIIRSLSNSRLNSSIIISLAIAFIVACPIACLAMNKWLENFAYKTTLSWWILALAGILALGMALLTVSWSRLLGRKRRRGIRWRHSGMNDDIQTFTVSVKALRYV